MAKNSPAFQFYPADFLIGTATMSAAAVGCYIRLLSHQWALRGLPDDKEILLRLCYVSSSEFNAIWEEISCKFERCEDGLLRNARLDSVMQRAEILRETRQKVGSKGGVANAKQKGWQKSSKGRLKNEDRRMKFVEDEDWVLPDGWDTPEVRKALDDWAAMRRRIGKPVRSKPSTSKVFKRFDSPSQLIEVCELCEANEWQGLKPEYAAKVSAKSKSFAQQRQDNNRALVAKATAATRAMQNGGGPLGLGFDDT